MSEPLFVFVAHGVATERSRLRPGARHALVLLGRGANIASARSVAVAGAESNGWQFIEIQRENKFDPDVSVMQDDVLRSAAEDAVGVGYSIMVFEDELPLDG